MTQAIERVGAIVVGGGQAGLAASHHLRRLGQDHVVLERDRVGSAWRRRWDSFTLVTPNWTVQLPGGEYDGPNPDGFLPRDEVVAYLERYAADVPVREGIDVSAVDPQPDGGFIVTSTGGTFAAPAVVIATGMYQSERASPLRAGLAPAIHQVHTSGYRNPDALPPGGVLVVGSGQSGCQIAEELLEAGRDVHFSVGTAGRAPRRYRGRDMFRWLQAIGFLDRTPDKLPSPKAKFAGNPHLSGKRGGHTLNVHRFAHDGMQLYGHLSGADGTRVRFAPDLHANLRGADRFATELFENVDKYIAAAGIDAPPRTPENTDEYDGLDGFEQPERPELDLAAVGITTVVWAGGYRFDYGMVNAPVLDADGFPITRRGVTNVPGLYFLGMHFLHDGKSAIFLGVGADAENVATHLVEHVRGGASPA